MTASELRDYFNRRYGTTKPWPEEFEVDEQTLVNVHLEVVRWITDHWATKLEEAANDFAYGRVMYKNVKLVLKK